MSDIILTDRQTDRQTCVAGTLNTPQQREVANCNPARYACGISNLRSEGHLAVVGYGRDSRKTE